MKSQEVVSIPKMEMEIELVLLDKKGNKLPIFNENSLGEFMLKIFKRCPKISLFGEYKQNKVITN